MKCRAQQPYSKSDAASCSENERIANTSAPAPVGADAINKQAVNCRRLASLGFRYNAPMTTRIVKNLRFAAGMTAGRYDWALRTHAKLRGMSDRLVTSDTDLCIEGFQRSANSFFYRVVRRCNRQLQIAHHLHAVAQFRRAKRFDVPAVALIREPVDTVSSLLASDPRLSINLALSTYTRFLHDLAALTDSILVTSFDQATKQPGKVIAALNQRFGCQLLGVDITRQQLDRLRQRLHQGSEQRAFAPVPNALKEARKAELRPKIENHTRLAAAQQAFRSIEKFV